MSEPKIRFNNPEGEQLLKDIEDFETKRLDAICNAFRIPSTYFDRRCTTIEPGDDLKDKAGVDK